MNIFSKKISSDLFFLLIYVAALVIKPQARFEFLGRIHYEQIIILLLFFSILMKNKLRLRNTHFIYLVLIWYFWMLFCHFLSPYSGVTSASHWFSEYWKLIIFFFMVTFVVTSLKDLKYFFLGITIISFCYQFYTWFDFLKGGSFVYQQGIRRIVGIWTGGIGSANAFGFLALLSIPFGLFCYRITSDKNKYFYLFFILLCMFSIIFSGTRGALLGVLFLLLINIKSTKLLVYYGLVTLILGAIAFYILPDDLKYRYFKSKSSNFQIEEKNIKGGDNSAHGRIEGLIDGWHLVLNRPIFGYGPGTSSIARWEVNPELYSNLITIQLHNLYGQILSETGFIGALIFSILIIKCFFDFKRLKKTSHLIFFCNTLRNYIWILLFYGMVGHTLYKYYWLLFFGCHVCLMEIYSRNINDGLPEGVSD